jgi:hypothetical protein
MKNYARGLLLSFAYEMRCKSSRWVFVFYTHTDVVSGFTPLLDSDTPVLVAEIPDLVDFRGPTM